MNLEDQCVSLEYAKKLKELGLKQECHFSWVNINDGYKIWPSHMLNNHVCSAFTASELGEIQATEFISKEGWKGDFNITKFIDKNNQMTWCCSYGHARASFDSKLCDAMAKMLIRDIEEGNFKIE